ncbi:MAG: biotin--[acetyl-CoA-carboxylase] ligase [Pseudomonadota bacterium]
MHWPVVTFDDLDSTNMEAQRRIAAGVHEPTWIRAGRQTAGRGRSGRSWQSLNGNLLASLLLPLQCPPSVLHHLSLVSGLALHQAITEYSRDKGSSLKPSLKWPNDVLIDDAKVAGILVESSIVGNRAMAIIGFGVNLQAAPQLQDRNTTSLSDHGLITTPDEFLPFLDSSLANTISIWDNGREFDRIRQAWLNNSFPLDHPIAINTTQGRVQGGFAGLDNDGALLIRTTDGKIELFHFGDVAVGGEAATSANGETRTT